MKTALTVATVLCLGGCSGGAPAIDDLPHPREMGLPEASFSRPDPEELQLRLANGMIAYVVEDSSVPLVTIAAVVDAGTLEGPVAGAAEALAAAWRRGGMATRSAAQVAAALERMVAELTVTQSAEETVLTLNVPREDFTEAVELFAQLVRRPSITFQDVAASAARTSRGATQYAGSLDDAVDAFRDHLYDGHPLGRAPGSSGRVTPNRAREYHARFVTPGSVTLAVGGDISRSEVANALTSQFADWGASEAVERSPVPAIRSDSRRDVLLHPADKLQGWIVMGHELPAVPVEDEAALQVMNYILGGGHFDTRLFRAARDRRGLTNDNSGFLDAGTRAPGSYTFRTYGRPEVIPLLIHLTFEEIDRIRAAPVSPEELFVAKGALADGEFTLGYRDGPTTAVTFAREWTQYRNHERSASYQERVRSVTAEEVQAVAQLYLLPEKIDIVILGPISEILNVPPLEGELPIRALGVASGPGAGL